MLYSKNTINQTNNIFFFLTLPPSCVYFVVVACFGGGVVVVVVVVVVRSCDSLGHQQHCPCCLSSDPGPSFHFCPSFALDTHHQARL